MSIEENKALIRRYFDEINKLNIAVLDELVSPDYVDHNPPPFPGLAAGHEGAKQAFAMAANAFSDVYHTVEDQLAEGDLVVSRLSVVGCYTGELMDIPPNNGEVAATGIAIHRIKDGKIVEHWAQLDLLALLQGMGAIPAPDQVAGV
jgi:predicted ester cyclase